MTTGEELEADGTGTMMTDETGDETVAFEGIDAETETEETESMVSEVVAEAEAGAAVEECPCPIPREIERSMRLPLDSV